jgi:hypothetical protein
MSSGGANYLRIIAVGHDYTAPIWPEIAVVEHCPIQRRRQPPIETVAKIEIVRPLAITQKVRTADFDFHNDDLPLWVDSHQVRSPPVAERHFRQAPDFITGKQPTDAARNGRRIGPACTCLMR